MSTEASGQCPQLSPSATTCSTKRHGNHSYSQAARCSARTQSRDQQGCTVCAAAALITSITETPARDETQGPRGLRGSSSSTTLSQSESLSDPPALSAAPQVETEAFSPLTPGTPEPACQTIQITVANKHPEKVMSFPSESLTYQPQLLHSRPES